MTCGTNHLTRRARMKRFALKSASLLALGAMVTACTGNADEGPESSPGSKGGSVVILQNAEAPALDPTLDYLGHQQNIAHQILEPMVWLDENVQPDPRLAVSWKNIEPLVWEVALRSGVTFSNGEEFNADSVVASFEYFKRPKSLQGARFVNWERVEKVDDHIVRIHTIREDPRFLATLVQLVIMPASVIANSPESIASKPVGTGPFVLSEWTPGGDVVLTKNPLYWRGEPAVDKLIFRTVSEASARVSSLLAGEADLIVNVPPEQIDLIESSPATKILSSPGVRGVELLLDTRQPPFDDVRVRQALNYAIDWESINSTLFDGRAKVAVGASHPSTFGHNSDLSPYPFDPDRARALLKEAGHGGGLSVPFHYSTGRWMKDGEVAQAVAGMLQAVGIQTELKTAEYNTYQSNMWAGKLTGIAMIGVLSYLDADRTASLFLRSGGPNTIWVNDSKLDQLFDAALVLDPRVREQRLHELEEYVYEQAFWGFGYWQPNLFGASEQLVWDPPGEERLDLWNIALKP